MFLVDKSELSGAWEKKLSESDERKKKDERSVPSFSSPNAFDTFGSKSMEDSVRNIANWIPAYAGMTETRNYLSISIGITTGVRPVRR